jgi:hypothetical protein
MVLCRRLPTYPTQRSSNNIAPVSLDDAWRYSLGSSRVEANAESDDAEPF